MCSQQIVLRGKALKIKHNDLDCSIERTFFTQCKSTISTTATKSSNGKNHTRVIATLTFGSYNARNFQSFTVVEYNILFLGLEKLEYFLSDVP